jgi:hypothetical protein
MLCGLKSFLLSQLRSNLFLIRRQAEALSLRHDVSISARPGQTNYLLPAELIAVESFWPKINGNQKRNKLAETKGGREGHEGAEEEREKVGDKKSQKSRRSQ